MTTETAETAETAESAESAESAETAETAEYDWSEITGQAVIRLRAPKIAPVPAPVIALAQKAHTGVQHPDDPEGTLRHTFRHEFTSDPAGIARAAVFAKHLRNAAPHTQPPAPVSVVIDPDKNGSAHVVAWRARRKAS